MRLLARCFVFLLCIFFFQGVLGDTKIFYSNGIWTTKKEAIESATTLYVQLKSRYQNLTVEEFVAVIKMGVAYNRTSKESGDYLADLFDSFVQFSEQSSAQFWRVLAGIEAMPDFLQNEFANSAASIDKFALVTNADVEYHVNLYRQALSKYKKVVIAAHSQGNFYANQSFGNLTPEEKDRVNIVAVATPDNSVAGQVPPYTYTILYEDFIWTIPGALPYNITNGGLIPSVTGHFFIESYLNPGSNSESKIINDMISHLDFTERSVQYLTFIEGDPGVPGDGATITPAGGTNPFVFELASPYSLKDVTDGITVAFFPPNPPVINVADFQIYITNLNSLPECVVGVYSVGFPGGSIFFNGVQGGYENYPQWFLETIVDIINNQSPLGCNAITLGDLYVTGLVRNTFPITEPLDAAAILLGEDAFPMQ